MAKPDQLHLTPVTEGLVTSVLLLGAAFGALFCGKLADLYGRRRMILNLSFLFLLASVGTAFAPNVSTMVVFRFLLGLAVWGASSMVPAFLAEMAPYEKRGRMVTQNELMNRRRAIFSLRFQCGSWSCNGRHRAYLEIHASPVCGSGSHLIYKHAHCSGKHQRFFMWMLNFMIGFTFPVMLSSVGLSVTFFVFVALKRER